MINFLICQIKWGAVGAVMIGNIFIFGTMLAFFKRLDEGASHVIHIKVDLDQFSNGKDAIWAMLKHTIEAKEENRPPC